MFESLARVTALFCQEECHSQAEAKRRWHGIKRCWHVSTRSSLNGPWPWKSSTTVGENFRESTGLSLAPKFLPSSDLDGKEKLSEDVPETDGCAELLFRQWTFRECKGYRSAAHKPPCQLSLLEISGEIMKGVCGSSPNSKITPFGRLFPCLLLWWWSINMNSKSLTAVTKPSVRRARQ